MLGLVLLLSHHYLCIFASTDEILSMAEAELAMNSYFKELEHKITSKSFRSMPQVVQVVGASDVAGNYTRVPREYRYTRGDMILAPDVDGRWAIFHSSAPPSMNAKSNYLDAVVEAVPWRTSVEDEEGHFYAFDGAMRGHEVYRRKVDNVVLFFDKDSWVMAHSTQVRNASRWEDIAKKCDVVVQELVWEHAESKDALQAVEVQDSCGVLQGTYAWGEKGYERNDGVTLRLENRWTFRKNDAIIQQALSIGGTPAEAEWKSFEVDGQRMAAISASCYANGNTFLRKNGDDVWVIENFSIFTHNHDLLGRWNVTTLRPGPTESYLVAKVGTSANLPLRGRKIPWRDRLSDALRQATNPVPGLNACFALKIDMAAAGLPGLTVTLSVRGEFDYDICNHCFSWKFESTIGFAYGLQLLGRGLFLYVRVRSGVELREMRCNEAKSAPFCQYLHLMVPADRGVSVSGQRERCHSYSPFEIVSAYITYWWHGLGHRWKKGQYSSHAMLDSNHTWFDEKIHSWSDEIKNKYPEAVDMGPVTNFENALEERIMSIKPQMEKYMDIFKKERTLDPMSGDTLASQWGKLEKEDRLLFMPISTQTFGYVMIQPFRKSEGGVRPIFCWSLTALATDCPTVDDAVYQKTQSQISLNEVKEATFDEQTNTVRIQFHQMYHMLEFRKRSQEHMYVRITEVRDGKRWFEAFKAVKRLWDLGGPKKFLRVRAVKALEIPRHGDGPWNDPDPFCEIEVLAQKYSTPYYQDSVNPVWNATNAFAIDHDHGISQPLEVAIRIYDLDNDILARRQLIASRICKLYEKLPADVLHDNNDKCTVEVPAITMGSLNVASDGLVSGENLSGVYERVSWHKWANDAHCIRRHDIEGSDDFVWVFEKKTHEVLIMSRDGPANPAEASWAVHNVKIHRIHFSSDITGDDYEKDITVEFTSGWSKKAKITLSFEFLHEPKVSFSRNFPNLGNVLQAHAAAAHQFSGKLMRFGSQVGQSFLSDSRSHHEEVSYINSQGRYLARNLRNSKLRTITSGTDKKSNSDTSALDKIKDALEALRRKWRDIVAKVKGDNPCAMFHNPVGDSRMLNFYDVLASSKYKDGDENHSDKAGKRPMDFYAEVATSLANSFVRVTGDVQAIFNSYFADDTDFDGDCYALNPIHHLPYEFSSDVPNMFFTELQGFAQVWAKRRTKDHVRAPDPNPFKRSEYSQCQYVWSSPAIGHTDGTQFATVTPPDNSGEYHQPTPQGPLRSVLYPHFLCELTKKKGREFMAYQSACRQLKFETFFNQTSEDRESIVTSWRRFECERVTIQPALKALFPHLVKKMKRVRQDLGTMMEDVLQCAGRISPAMREFPNTEKLPEACNLNFDHLASKFFRESNDTFDKSESMNLNTNVLRQKTIQMLYMVRGFIVYLQTHAPPGAGMDASTFMDPKDDDPKFMEDFMNQAGFWDLGGKQVFLGDLYTEDDLERTAALFDTKEKIAKRVSDTKEHLVMKAWEQSGEAHLFSPPVHFVEWSAFEFGVEFHFDSIKEPCRGADLYVAPGAAQLDLKFLKEGLTWAPHFEVDSIACVEINFRPIQKMVVNLQRCTAGDDIVKWRIGTQSILALEETEHVQDVFNKNVKKHLDEMAASSQLQPEDLETYKVNADTSWKIAKEVLSPSGKLRLGHDSAKAVWESVKEIMGGAKQILVDEAKRFETDIKKIKPGPSVKKAVNNFDLTLTNAKILAVDIVITSSSDGNWHRTFDVKYKSLKQADFNFDSPGIFNVQSAVSFSLNHDLSKIFDVFFGSEQVHDDPDPFDLCVQCFAVDKRDYYNKLIPVKACVRPAHKGGSVTVECRLGTDQCASGEAPVDSAFKCGTIQKPVKPLIDDMLEKVWAHFYTRNGKKSVTKDKAGVLAKHANGTELQFFDGAIQTVPNAWIQNFVPLESKRQIVMDEPFEEMENAAGNEKIDTASTRWSNSAIIGITAATTLAIQTIVSLRLYGQ